MTMTTNIQTNRAGVANHAVGSIVTNADAATAVTLTLGFTPRKFVLHNLTDRISDEWYEGMAAASSLHTVATGTRTLEAVNGITVSGLNVTMTAVTMVASKTYAWEAIG